MQDKQKESSFDVRITQRNISSGRLTSAELEERLAELEDCADEADWTVTRMSIPPRADTDES